MITVAIFINGNPLVARSAYNTGDKEESKTIYSVDDGSVIEHDNENGTMEISQDEFDKELKELADWRW